MNGLKRKDFITFPPTFIPSVTEYIAGGGFGDACAENRPFGLSTNSRFRSLPGGAPTLNSYAYLKYKEECVRSSLIPLRIQLMVF